MTAVSSIGFACLALGLGMILYHRIHWLRKYLIQPALIAGIFLLILGGQGFGLLDESNYGAWSAWPGFLISFLFSSLILAAPVAQQKESRSGVFFQGSYVWILALGQIALGLLVISFFDERWWVAGHIIEIGWMGGHGSAAALIAVSEDLGHRDAAELALFSATIGLLYGSISGMFLINWLKSRWTKPEESPHSSMGAARVAGESGRIAQESRRIASESGRSSEDRAEEESEESAAMGTPVSGEGQPGLLLDDSAAWLLALIGTVVPVLIAYAFMEVLGSALSGILPQASSYLKKLPLFFIALLFAFPVRKLLQQYGFLDSPRYRVLNSLILEFLIVSAVATLNLKLFLASWEILLALSLAGALWTAFCFFLLAPRLLPYHPDLSIINYGMSTGVTALGLLLLRSYRNHIPSAPATVYGLAAPFSAPFIGGGIISLLLPAWTVTMGPLMISGMVILILIAFILFALWMRKKISGAPQRER